MQKNMKVDGKFEIMELVALMDVQGGNEKGNIFLHVRNAIVELFHLNKKDENKK